MSAERRSADEEGHKTMIHEWKITETVDGFLLEERDNRGNIWPPTIKPSKRDVIARLIQVMKVGPVAPKIEPEIVFVGSITLGNSGDQPPDGDGA